MLGTTWSIRDLGVFTMEGITPKQRPEGTWLRFGMQRILEVPRVLTASSLEWGLVSRN